VLKGRLKRSWHINLQIPRYATIVVKG